MGTKVVGRWEGGERIEYGGGGEVPSGQQMVVLIPWRARCVYVCEQDILSVCRQTYTA
jgi:hypothetical protein